MWCWNALSNAQQLRLIQHGNLPIDFRPEGTDCDLPADCGVETWNDTAPGPRFYCYACAIAELKILKKKGGHGDYRGKRLPDW
jgi:hypothetical protein